MKDFTLGTEKHHSEKAGRIPALPRGYENMISPISNAITISKIIKIPTKKRSRKKHKKSFHNNSLSNILMK
jgi:hypothetical protein